MASSNENVSMALFCDFENVALGVRDANYDRFDIKPVLERLLLKGSIVVKKAYCDWDRYKGFKAPMHEANFELIEIPHVRQSGKNSADIRMVVDALDLCYTKAHVDTFVIISGDSDFSPLVSKLRENAKKVIGVGVKQSTSDLLVANCDEFIFYDDLVRESRRARRDAGEAKPAVKRTPEEERARREEMDKRRNQAVEIAINTFEALVLERGDSGKIWASVLKEAIKRRKPDFSESYYGFRTFGNLIEECKARGLLEFGRDEKSGAYVYRGSGVPNGAAPAVGENGAEGADSAASAQAGSEAPGESRRSRNRGRTAAERFAERQAERLARQGRSAQPEGDASAITIETAPQADVNAAEPVAELADAAQAAHHAEQAQAERTADVQAPAQGAAREGRERGRHRGGRDRGARNERNAFAAVDAGAANTPVAGQDNAAGNVAMAADAAPGESVEHHVPVVLEAAVDLPAPASVDPAVEAVPPKKKSGAKPPARKLKAAAKAPAEGKPGKGGKGKQSGQGGQASQPALAAAVATPAAAVPADPVPALPARDGTDLEAVSSAAAVAPAAPAAPAADDAASAAAEKPAKPARAKAARAKPAARAPKAAKPAKADAAPDGADE